MRVTLTFILAIACTCFSAVSASVALPGLGATSLSGMSQRPSYARNFAEDDSAFEFRRRQLASSMANGSNKPLAMAIPGYGVAEQVVIGGMSNFLQFYNLIITGRVLLSWFPQAQSIGVLQPVFQITDPYLNLFRGIIPPIFGLDLSPILAFVTLNLLTSSIASVGCEIPEDLKKSELGRNAARGFAMMK